MENNNERIFYRDIHEIAGHLKSISKSLNAILTEMKFERSEKQKTPVDQKLFDDDLK